MTDILLVERDDKIATVTLNRPEKRNALSDALRRKVAAGFEQLEKDDTVSAVVLTGAGPAFCAGFDLSEFQPSAETFSARSAWEPGQSTSERLEAFADSSIWESGQMMHERLQAFAKPLVGAINGPALAGGFDVAVQCDVRIASEAAVFGHPEIKFGAPTLFTILSRIIGGGMARDLALSGRRIDAQEALRIGLVTKVVPPDLLMEEAIAYARTVAEAPLETLKVMKAAIARGAPFEVP
jgi:enoyl-CoA hydratase